MQVQDIPAIDAALNATSTILLLAGFAFIRTRRIAAHRACMIGAFVVSTLFLVGYVTHKILVGGVHHFGGHGAISTIYYVMLISHSFLAMVIVPLVLRTIYLAWKGRFLVHRAWARWTFPIWLYVSVTGVLVYFFLYRWFPDTPIAGV